MFEFIQQIIVSTLIFFGNLSSVNPLECISFKNKDCKAKPEIINVNSNDAIFYPFSIKTKKCSIIVIILMIHMQEFVLLIL